ncbi:MAG: thiosulfate oxidation carrier complex protein SoxZ [Campylobacterota bacterium]|nr:thiosulfate oxidation carrier complex protein SoxZ [Campylobacterota bacterium]
MKVKAKLKKDVVKVKMMAKHEMSTYNQAEKKTGDRENANFITHLSGTVNDKVVIDISTSQFLSKNPIFQFQFKGDEFKQGDELSVTWVDRKGKTETKKVKIK